MLAYLEEDPWDEPDAGDYAEEQSTWRRPFLQWLLTAVGIVSLGLGLVLILPGLPLPGPGTTTHPRHRVTHLGRSVAAAARVAALGECAALPSQPSGRNNKSRIKAVTPTVMALSAKLKTLNPGTAIKSTT